MRREMNTNAFGDVVPIRRLKFKRSKSSSSSTKSLSTDKENSGSGGENIMPTWEKKGSTKKGRKKRQPLSVLSLR